MATPGVTPYVSVVVPTFERVDALPEVVSAIEAQEGAPPFELIIVDDGSDDGTAEFLKAHRFSVSIQIIRQENRGPASARNAGVAAARGELIAFLGDDMVPSPSWLSSHCDAHRWRGDDPLLAVVGYTGWHPSIRATAFLRFINEHGPQFGWATMEDADALPFYFFYGSNLSIRRVLLLDEPFDIGFPDPVWEDTELAYRLVRRGLRLVYDGRASAGHRHATNYERFAARQEKVGYYAIAFWRRHPELAPFLKVGTNGPPPVPSEVLQRMRERAVRALEPLPLRLHGLWRDALRHHYIKGMHRAWNEASVADPRAGALP